MVLNKPRVARFLCSEKHRSMYFPTLTLLLWSLCLVPVNATAQQVLVIDVNVFGLNANQNTATEQLNDSCSAISNGEGASAAERDLANTCGLVSDLDPNDPANVTQLQTILDAVGPEEAFSMNDSIVYVSDYQTTNVYSRINTIRNTPLSNINFSGLVRNKESLIYSNPDTTIKSSAMIDRMSGGGAATDGLLSRLGVFFSGQVSDGDIDGDTFEQDSDLKSSSFTVGSDYRLSNNIIVGAGIGVIQNQTDFSNVAGSTESDGVNLTFFGSWYEEDQGYVDAVLDIGTNSYDLERDISTTSATQVLALGDTDSSTLSFTVGAGRSFNFKSWDLGGYFRLSITDASVDGYTERASNTGPGFGSVFSIGSQSVSSQKMVIGAEASRTINTSKAIFVPVIRIELESENEKNKDNLEATLVASQITSSYQGTDRDSRYTNLGIGGSVILQNGRSAYAFYETHLQHDFVSQNWFKAGFRFEF